MIDSRYSWYSKVVRKGVIRSKGVSGKLYLKDDLLKSWEQLQSFTIGQFRNFQCKETRTQPTEQLWRLLLNLKFFSAKLKVFVQILHKKNFKLCSRRHSCSVGWVQCFFFLCAVLGSIVLFLFPIWLLLIDAEQPLFVSDRLWLSYGWA